MLCLPVVFLCNALLFITNMYRRIPMVTNQIDYGAA